MTKKEITQFVELAEGITICGYSDQEQAVKEEFHRQGKRLLRVIAKRMSLPRGSYEVRSNMGGVAVCGEVTLHGEHIYIQLSQSCLGKDFGFMYRYVRDRRDYTGGTNRWMAWTKLMDLDENIHHFQEAMIGGAQLSPVS